MITGQYSNKRCPLAPCSECLVFWSSALSGNSSVCNSISFQIEANIGQSLVSGHYFRVNEKPIHDVHFCQCYQKYHRQGMRVKSMIRKPRLLSLGLLPWWPGKMSLLGQCCCNCFLLEKAGTGYVCLLCYWVGGQFQTRPSGLLSLFISQETLSHPDTFPWKVEDPLCWIIWERGINEKAVWS